MPDLPPRLDAPLPAHEEILLPWEGRRRRCLLYRPAHHDALRPTPLVLMLHGGGGTAELAARASGWSTFADDAHCLVAYPEGMRPRLDEPASFRHNPQFWNVYSGLSHSEKTGIDDIGFIGAVIDEISRRCVVDSRRVYATGFSNGASMSFILGLALAHRLAAIAPVAGKLWRHDVDLPEPVSLLYIVGELDPLNPLHGGAVDSPWGKSHEHARVEQTVERWRRLLNLPDAPAIDTTSGEGVRRRRWGPGPDGREIDFYIVGGAGHCWPGGVPMMNERVAGPHSNKLHATELIWEFFERHARQMS